MSDSQGLKTENDNKNLLSLPEVLNFQYMACLLITIKLGALNLGYVLSYMTLSIDTIFATLDIGEQERTDRLSLINGIAPVGAFSGCFLAFFLKKKLTNKQCLHVADLCGILSIVTLIPNYGTIVAFRFFLGLSNGINSVIMPSTVKQMSPEKYFPQFSMAVGYLSSTGLLIGQLMGLGYLSFRGKGSYWWNVVFIFPPLVCLVRSALMLTVFNFETPEQSIRLGKDKDARHVIELLYKSEDVDRVYENVQQKVASEPTNQHFSRFWTQIKHKRTVTIGIAANLVQQWCGSFAVFYYGAQINKELAQGDLTMITIYTIAIGLCMFFPQFLNISLSKSLGVKLMLQYGSFAIAIFNIITVIFSGMAKEERWLVVTLAFMLALIACFSMVLQPNTWSITTQLNEPDGVWISMLFRWGFQMIMIFSFPYIIKQIGISGAFIIFAAVCFIHGIFVIYFVKDQRGLTQKQIMEWYNRPVVQKQQKVVQLTQVDQQV